MCTCYQSFWVLYTRERLLCLKWLANLCRLLREKQAKQVQLGRDTGFKQQLVKYFVTVLLRYLPRFAASLCRFTCRSFRRVRNGTLGSEPLSAALRVTAEPFRAAPAQLPAAEPSATQPGSARDASVPGGTRPAPRPSRTGCPPQAVTRTWGSGELTGTLNPATSAEVPLQRVRCYLASITPTSVKCFETQIKTTAY